MDRTTIILPPQLKSQLQDVAASKNISFGALIREALSRFLFLEQNPTVNDSFLKSKTVFNETDSNGNTAVDHDSYLYNDPHQ